MESAKPREGAAAPPKPARRPVSLFGSKRQRLLINLGCAPIVFLLVIALLALINFVSFVQVPTWVTDKQSYRVSGQLLISVITVSGIQALITWALGLAAALFGLKAAAGQGALVARRVEVIRRRLAIGAWAIIAIRIVLLAVLVVGIIYLYTNILGFRLSWDLADEAAGFVMQYPVVLGLAVIVILAQWLVGPLLRLRYSISLGALAGTWAQDRDQRPWLALSLRLGTELAGMLAILWGATALRILAGIIFDPVGYPALPQYPDLFPQLPPRTASLATALVAVALVLLAHTFMQILSARMAVAEAGRRLARPKKLSFHAKAGEEFRELARSSSPKSEAR